MEDIQGTDMEDIQDTEVMPMVDFLVMVDMVMVEVISGVK
jgi:hypothetical protein